MNPFIPTALPFNFIDWSALVTQIGTANRALARYDGILHGVPNPRVMLSPLTTREAIFSAKIEGTQTNFQEVLEFEAQEHKEGNDDLQEIINYRTALAIAEKALSSRPFGLNLLKELHSILLDSVRGRNQGRGHIRTIQNWIGPRGCLQEEADFVPPEPLSVPHHLDNWEKYYHIEDLDPLVQLALVHAQFEIIHPFFDGNGRLGRILIPLFLYEKDILSRPMFYLSSYLEEHRDEYVDRLRLLNGPDAWNAWVQFFLRALTAQARANAKTAQSIMSLYEDLKARVLNLTHSQYAVPLLDRLFTTPVFRASSLASDETMPSRPMITTMLGKLKKANIVQVIREGSGRRPQTLALGELINVCEGRDIFDT